jgi:2'-hydroxyisoflavone reductase
MRVLIVGGTVFLGRCIVDELLRRGHSVTILTRGRENPDLFPQCERVVADRNVDMAPLGSESFDAVVDTCAYQPEGVRLLAGRLAPRTPRYLLISSSAVYQGRVGGRDEVSPTWDRLDPDEVLSGPTLGRFKAACERELVSAYGDDAIILRCGRMTGPGDVASRSRRDARGDLVADFDYDAAAGRIPYWPLRVSENGDFLAPEPRDQRVQVIDARDVATFVGDLLEEGRTGCFNVTGPTEYCLTMAGLLDACIAAAGTDATPVWVGEEYLLANGVASGTELPLWAPRRPDYYALDLARATDAGLRCRPLVETMRDVLRWAQQAPELALAPNSPVLGRERERRLIEGWRTASEPGATP